MKNMKRYHDVQVLTSDGVRIIIMLCEGVMRFNKLAEKAIREGDVKEKNNYINRSFAIISELSNSLNMEEGGEIAMTLARLYDFSLNQLTLANLNNDPAAIETVTRVIGELKAGWEAVAKDRTRREKEHDATNGATSYGA
ncbi:MAG: flagellar export chaperone FliS [Deltaproteobacteria bacterium]|nr:flagellar export chaperone FliS [Deltaproteobacteria bacterium]